MQFVAHTWSNLSHQTIDQLGCWSHLNSKCAFDFPYVMCEHFAIFHRMNSMIPWLTLVIKNIESFSHKNVQFWMLTFKLMHSYFQITYIGMV